MPPLVAPTETGTQASGIFIGTRVRYGGWHCSVEGNRHVALHSFWTTEFFKAPATYTLKKSAVGSRSAHPFWIAKPSLSFATYFHTVRTFATGGRLLRGGLACDVRD